MDAAWPAPDREESGGWVLRAAAGVTQRANSIWPRSEPNGTPHDRLALLRDARAWYRSRRLPVIFQVFDNAGSAALNAVLDEEGFTRQSETLILVRGAGGDPPAPDAGVELSAEPTDEWLRLWWSVDGRGDEDSLATARGILEGCPSLYALVRDDDGVPAAVGRLALPLVGEQAIAAGCTAWRPVPMHGAAVTPPGCCRYCCGPARSVGWTGTGCWSPRPTPEHGSCMPGPDSRRPAATSTGRSGRERHLTGCYGRRVGHHG